MPVKGSAGGKGRLAGLLNPEERAALVRAMLRDVVAAPLHSPAVRTVAVTSRDAHILELAGSLGALPLPEPPHSHGLNPALEAAIATLTGNGADAVLILQGDVPEVGPDDVSALLAGITESGAPLVRAAPTADGGTSALLLYPPRAIPLAFGTESFARHQQAARALAVPFERCDLPTLAIDIDRPEDLAHLLTSGHAPHTRAALITAGLPERLAWG